MSNKVSIMDGETMDTLYSMAMQGAIADEMAELFKTLHQRGTRQIAAATDEDTRRLTEMYWAGTESGIIAACQWLVRNTTARRRFADKTQPDVITDARAF